MSLHIIVGRMNIVHRHTHAHTHTCRHTHTQMHTHTQTLTPHTYTHTRTHTHTHKYIYICYIYHIYKLLFALHYACMPNYSSICCIALVSLQWNMYFPRTSYHCWIQTNLSASEKGGGNSHGLSDEKEAPIPRGRSICSGSETRWR